MTLRGTLTFFFAASLGGYFSFVAAVQWGIGVPFLVSSVVLLVTAPWLNALADIDNDRRESRRFDAMLELMKMPPFRDDATVDHPPDKPPGIIEQAGVPTAGTVYSNHDPREDPRLRFGPDTLGRPYNPPSVQYCQLDNRCSRGDCRA